MYEFSKKKELKRRAKVAHIDTYRAMLAEHRIPAAGWVGLSPQELAEDLLYILLDHYTIEEIEARANSAAATPANTRQQTQKPGIEPVKKKFLSRKNIQISAGKTWTTLSSGLQTAYSRIESAAGSVFRSLKNSLRGNRPPSPSSRRT